MTVIETETAVVAETETVIQAEAAFGAEAETGAEVQTLTRAVTELLIAQFELYGGRERKTEIAPQTGGALQIVTEPSIVIGAEEATETYPWSAADMISETSTSTATEGAKAVA